MNPAAPVTSTLTKASGAGPPAPAWGGHGCRRRRGECGRSPPCPLVRAVHLVSKGDAGSGQILDVGAHFEDIVIKGGFQEPGFGLDHRQAQTPALELLVGLAQSAKQVRASDLEPREIVAVVRDSHLVRFGVAYPQGRDRSCRHRHAAISGARRAFGVAAAEYGGAGHGDVDSGLDDPADVREIDAAVDLDLDSKASFDDDPTQPLDLVERRVDELLPAEPGVHRHH